MRQKCCAGESSCCIFDGNSVSYYSKVMNRWPFFRVFGRQGQAGFAMFGKKQHTAGTGVMV